MIFYHQDLGTHFIRFGIDLPLRDDRADRVFSSLKESFPHLEPIDINSIPMLCQEDLALVHSQEFLKNWSELNSLKKALKKTYEHKDSDKKFEKVSLENVSAFKDHLLLQGAATLSALEMALTQKFIFFLGGGMHHARRDFGSGFCPFNDLVVAMRVLQKKGKIKRGLIIDVDAHMGDGTSEVTYDDPSIDTMSLHMAKQWPFQSELSITPSTYDDAFLPGEEETYLSRLEKALAFFDSRVYDAVIVVAGADPYELDTLPSSKDMRLSREQLFARDEMIYHWCQKKKVPQLWVMAGGYGDEAHTIYTQFLKKRLSEASSAIK